MIKITILSTLVGNKQIQTSATTFGELHSDLNVLGINYQNFKFVVGETKQTLELASAVLPTKDFVLVVTPIKTKAGAATYAEMKTFLKTARENAVNSKDEALLEMIGDYTHYTTTEMTEAYEEVMDWLNDEVEEYDLSELEDKVARIEERLAAVEIVNNILNEANSGLFFQTKRDEVADVLKELGI